MPIFDHPRMFHLDAEVAEVAVEHLFIMRSMTALNGTQLYSTASR